MAKKALIIDDNPEFVESVQDLLTANGYSVTTADNGSEGFKKAASSKPDLILLDVMMEDAGAGLDTVRKLRENKMTVSIPVFLVTGIQKPEFLLESFAPGEKFANVKRVFEKPVEPEEFLKALKSL